MSGRRRGAAAGCLAVIAALLAGCGGLPTASAVRVERSVQPQNEPAVPRVQVLPPGPEEGAGPEAIVNGFLAAQANPADNFAVARSFLADGARWDAQAALQTYSRLSTPALAAGQPAASLSPRPTSPDGTKRTVTVRGALAGSVDSAGTYRASARALAVTFPLAVVRGQWRITTAPPGLLLSPRDFARSYTPATVWWLTPDDKGLVPEVRWLPAADEARATSLIKALLGGPSAVLGTAVRTAIPNGTQLRGAATVIGGQVSVDLSRPAADGNVAEQAAMLRQIARTVQQLPQVDVLRVTVQGQPLSSRRTAAGTSIAALVGTADPDLAGGAVRAYALLDARAVPTDVAGRSRSAAAVAALPSAGLQSLAVSPVGDAAAAIVAGGRVVLVRGGVSHVLPAVAGAVSLSFDAAGDLAVAGPDTLMIVSADGSTHPVSLTAAGLPADLHRVALARDGVRVVVVAGPPGRGRLFVGTVSKAASWALGPARDVLPTVPDVVDAAWADATTLAALGGGSGGTHLQVQSLAVDGSQLTESSPPAGTSAESHIAAGPGFGVLLGAAGLVQQQTASGWRIVARGSMIAVPG